MSTLHWLHLGCLFPLTNYIGVIALGGLGRRHWAPIVACPKRRAVPLGLALPGQCPAQHFAVVHLVGRPQERPAAEPQKHQTPCPGYTSDVADEAFDS